MWKAVGILIALAVAIAAWNRGRAAGGHYDADTYGMTPQTHRRYALGGLVLAALFAMSIFAPAVPATVVLAVAILVGVFYLSSFLRGAQADE